VTGTWLGTRWSLPWAMKADLASDVAEEIPGVDGSELDDLLSLFEKVTDQDALAMLRRRLCHQLLRAVEVAILADPVLVDIALNPGLYLGRETDILAAHLGELLGVKPPVNLIWHLRSLVMSGAAGAEQKISAKGFDEEVFRRYRLQSEQLRCLDCGYHFVEADLGQSRLDKAREFGFIFSYQKLARRLRDPWKPSFETALSVDHLIPEAGLGPTAPENLRIVCQFCNKEKRIYRWPGEANGRDVASAMLALGDPKRGLWAVRATTYSAIVDSGGRCLLCGRTTEEIELTARPLYRRGMSATVPWEMQAVCYECYDPAD
jgi:5-methylcytosine-specific restriction endonuclease McrA